MTARWSRVAWLGSLILACSANVGVYGFAMHVNWLYDQEPLIIVAPYAQPWRTVALLLIQLALAGVFGRGTFGGRRSGAVGIAAAVAASALAFALAVELASGLMLQTSQGELTATTLFGIRERVQLPASPDGLCVRGKFTNAWVWRFGDTAFHPRLLPLPREDRELRAALSLAERSLLQSTPGACPP